MEQVSEEAEIYMQGEKVIGYEEIKKFRNGNAEAVIRVRSGDKAKDKRKVRPEQARASFGKGRVVEINEEIQ